MDDETIQDAIDYCCDNPEGLDTEELLSKFPEYRDELVPLLAICNLIGDVPHVPPQRYEMMKQRVMAAAALSTQPAYAMPAQKQAQPRPPRPQAARANTGRRIFIFEWLKRPALAAGLLALLMVGFVWSASASSLPDSPLYNVKILAENVSFNFANSPADKARMHATLAEERLNDLEKMQQQHKLDGAGLAFSDYARHLQQGQDLLNVITADDAKAEVAGRLYRTCRKGQVEFSSFDIDVAKLPETVKRDYDVSATAQNTLSKLSENVLITYKISPLTVIDRPTRDVLQKTPGPEATQIAQLSTEPTGTTLNTITQDNGLATGTIMGTTGTTGPGATNSPTQQSIAEGSSTPRAGLTVATAAARESVSVAVTPTTPTAQPSQSGTAQTPSQTAEPPTTKSPTSTLVAGTATASSTASRQAGETSTALPTKQRPTGTESPKPTPEPPKTPTVLVNRPTDTAIPAPTTATPQSTNDRPPSHTPRPTDAIVPPVDTPRPSTSTPNPPTQTRVPPGNTPLTPSNTPVPSSIMTATPGQTQVPSPTATSESRERAGKTPPAHITPPPERTPHDPPEATKPPESTKPPDPHDSPLSGGQPGPPAS